MARHVECPVLAVPQLATPKPPGTNTLGSGLRYALCRFALRYSGRPRGKPQLAWTRLSVTYQRPGGKNINGSSTTRKRRRINTGRLRGCRRLIRTHQPPCTPTCSTGQASTQQCLLLHTARPPLQYLHHRCYSRCAVWLSLGKRLRAFGTSALRRSALAAAPAWAVAAGTVRTHRTAPRPGRWPTGLRNWRVIGSSGICNNSTNDSSSNFEWPGDQTVDTLPCRARGHLLRKA